MSVLENFKNIPRSPSHRATGPKCNFFSLNLQRSPWRKKKEGGPVAPPNGRQGGLSPPLGRPMGPAHERGRGACRPPPTGDRGACRPPLGRPLGPAHGRGRGACRPPWATGGLVAPPPRATGVTPYISSNPPSLLI